MHATFGVDLDDLSRVISGMRDCEAALDRLTAELAYRVAELHLDWAGPAADAHLRAQAEWDRGLAAMRSALSEFEVASQRASGNYAQAADTNAQMWRRTR